MTLHHIHFCPAPDPLTNSAFVAVTLRLFDPASDALVGHVRLLRDCVALAQKRNPFEIEAAAVLPNTFYLLCRSQDQLASIGATIKLITEAFARHGPQQAGGIWSDVIEIEEIDARMVAPRRRSIEEAPVRAGLVARDADWPYCSAGMTNFGVAAAKLQEIREPVAHVR